MNKKSLKITTGAMVTAIFGVMLLLNRQTGSLFQGVFLFIYPIPMVAYAALYGWKSGIPALLAMTLLSFLLGDFTTIFYAVTQAFVGLVFGGCLYHKIDMTKILFAVMILSALISVLNIIMMEFLSGIDLNQEVEEMQKMMNFAFSQADVDVPEIMLTAAYLKQILVVSIILVGIVQGFVVYEISLLILRRLRFPVQKSKSLFLYVPPKWTGYGALLAFILYSIRMVQPLENDMMQNIVLTVGIFGYLYLICFGFIGILLVLKVRFPRIGAWGFVICLLGLFMFPTMELVAGFIYIVSRYHSDLLEQYMALK